MNTRLIVMMVICGICFGSWPIIIRNSGIGGNVQSLVWAVLASLCILPFALNEGLGQGQKANWIYLIVAGVLGGLGVLALNNGLSKAAPMQFGSAFLVMMIVQVAVPVVYELVKSGGNVSYKKLAAIAGGVLVIKVLLSSE